MKIFKLEIYRGNELIYSNVYNDNLVLICDRIKQSYTIFAPCKLFIVVRQMYFNNVGELKPKMHKGKFYYSISCTIDKTTSFKDIAELLGKRERNLIANKDFTI